VTAQVFDVVLVGRTTVTKLYSFHCKSEIVILFTEIFEE
jgi:hypothetical protein